MYTINADPKEDNPANATGARHLYMDATSNVIHANAKQSATVNDPPRTSNALANGARNMGQDLFNPPDVSGWDFNLGWVNTASMLERFNYTNQLMTNRNTTSPGVFVTTDQLRKYVKGNTKKTVNAFLSALNVPVSKALRVPLQTYLTTGDTGQPIAYTTDDAYVDKKIRGLVHLIGSELHQQRGGLGRQRLHRFERHGR